MAHTLQSINVANSLGGVTRPPILIAEEYNHWAIRMQSYLIRKGDDVWRSVVQWPYVPAPVRGVVITAAEVALQTAGQQPPAAPALTTQDIEKLQADVTAYNELICSIPPDIFDLVEDCSTAKEIWDNLANVYAGSVKARDKKQTSA